MCGNPRSFDIPEVGSMAVIADPAGCGPLRLRTSGGGAGRAARGAGIGQHTDLLIDFSDLAPGTELTLWNIRAARESSLLQDVGRRSAEPGLSFR
jgi:hypothetical protein